jgi:glycosyltransferase involved in cell wall biosynthesis
MLIHRFHPHVGGSETQLKALTPHLRARGIDVHVVTRPEPSAPRREMIDGAYVYRVPISAGRGAGSLGYTSGALRFLWRHRREIQLIHAHGLLSPSTTAVLGRALLRVPVVVTTHGFQADLNLLRAAPMGTQRLWVIGRAADRFVVISDEIGAALLSEGIEARKLAPIRSGIDADRFVAADSPTRAEIRSRLGLAESKVVLYVGRLEHVKGVDCLLDAWPSVIRDVPDAQLVIAGDGASRAGLEQRATPRVRFLGAQSDPLPLYQAADCYVLPSRSEGLPTALMEALSVELPVVCTAVGGITEILSGHESETLVQPDDPAELAARLTSQLRTPTSPASRDALRQRIRTSYSIAATADQLAGLYRSLAPSGVVR